MLLGVNIDHIATLRQARYRTMPESPNAEPCPVEAVRSAQRAGADSITLHIRGDRRHIQEKDAFSIKEASSLPLNLEMGNTPELLKIALQLKTAFVCLVPEKREEVSTEGGLDVLKHYDELGPTIEALQKNGSKVSLFVDPEPEQLEAAAQLCVEMVELHTGAYANADSSGQVRELLRLRQSAEVAHSLGMQVNAGHGINYTNVTPLLSLPHLAELNIGHSIVARAVVVGLYEAVREMKGLLSPSSSSLSPPLNS